MISNPVIFYTAAVLIILFALLAVMSKNVINSLLASIIVFFASAIIFYMLGSEYNAIIQAAIYGLAVPVIIGLSIMFTTGKPEKGKKNTLTFFVLFCSVLFLILFADGIFISNLKTSTIFNTMELIPMNSFDVLSNFAKGIFIKYVWAFELVSVLLTVIIAGIVMIARGKGAVKWK